MEIQWLGHACFRITHGGWALVIDPYNSDYVTGYPKLSGIRADQLLISHDSYGHNYAPGVELSGRPESDCPFHITELTAPHEFKMGNWRGFTLIHILKTEDLKIVHMGDLGTQLDGGQITQLFGADAAMVCAGSCTALPSQEAKRAMDEIMANVIIPMHYRHDGMGAHRLETVEDFANHFESPEMIHRYDTDTITITPGMEPQVAVLKYLGPEGWRDLMPSGENGKKSGLLSRLFGRK
jgi:L-ascorbate metabolism protein UlaG (beta-lactamase superfamily)